MPFGFGKKKDAPPDAGDSAVAAAGWAFLRRRKFKGTRVSPRT